MKKIFHISCLVLLSIVSCTRETLVENEIIVPKGERMVFQANLDTPSKSHLDPTDGKKLVWDETDRVLIASLGNEDGVVAYESVPISINSSDPHQAELLTSKDRSFWVGGEQSEGTNYSFFALYPAQVIGTNLEFYPDPEENLWLPITIPAEQDGVNFGEAQLCADLSENIVTRAAVLDGASVTFNNFQPLTSLLSFKMSAPAGVSAQIKKIIISTVWDPEVPDVLHYLAGSAALSQTGTLVPASEVSGLTGTPLSEISITLPEPIEVTSSGSDALLAAIIPSVYSSVVTLDFKAFDQDNNLRLEGTASSLETGFLGGKKYTFNVPMSEAKNTVLSVECLRNYPPEGGAYTGRVVSYTYEDGVKKAVKFSMKFFEDEDFTQEIDPETVFGENSFDNWFHFISFEESTTEVGVTTAQYGVNANQNIDETQPVLVEDAASDIRSYLRGLGDKGTPEQPHNLSSSSGSLDLEQISTANCYIINQPGHYLLPCVVGNGIKDGEYYEDAYIPRGGDDGADPIYCDYLGNKLITPVIGYTSQGSGKPTAAYLLWEDAQNLIFTSSDFAPSAEDFSEGAPVGQLDAIADYALQLVDLNELVGQDEGIEEGPWGIQFEVPQGSIDQGNAVIAVVDDLGRIMWSWHIWVTDYNPYVDFLPVTSYWSGLDYNFMKRNLGWVMTGISKQISFKPNYLYVQVTQVDNDGQPFEGGEEVKITLEQSGITQFDANIQHGYGPYWQAGRKDPFTPGSRGNDGYMHTVQTWGAVKAMKGKDFVAENLYDGTPRKLKDGIQNPYVYYYTFNDGNTTFSGNSWFTDQITTSLWNNVKLTGIGSDEEPEAAIGGMISEIITGKTKTYKTIYDPNPVGFVMPPMDAGGTFFAFFVGGKYENSLDAFAGSDINLREKYVSLLASASEYGASFYASTDKDPSLTGFLPQVGRRYHMLHGDFLQSNVGPIVPSGDSFLSGSMFDPISIAEFASAPNCGGYYCNIVAPGVSYVLLCSYPYLYFGYLTMSDTALPVRSMKEPTN